MDTFVRKNYGGEAGIRRRVIPLTPYFTVNYVYFIALSKVKLGVVRCSSVQLVVVQ